MDELCKVFTYVKVNDAFVEGATLEATLLGQDSCTLHTVQSLEKVKQVTNAAGYAELYLVRASAFVVGDGRYHIGVKDANGKSLVSITTTIPDAESVSVQALIA